MSEARDRDAAIEQWLRHLSAAEAELPASEHCLDPETMAAWIDRSLAGPARANADAHVAACARCQAIAATIARTESIAGWSVPERRSQWRWLTWVVPLSAAATVAAVIFVARRDHDRSREAPQSVSQVAPFAKPDQQKPGAAREEDEKKSLRDKAPPARSTDAIDAVAARKPAAAPSSPAAAPPSGRAAAQNAAASQARADESARTAELRQRQAEGLELEIRSPDPAVRWRIGRVVPGQTQVFARTATVVERSIDAGSTWTRTSTGVTADISAGASPAASVCWLVGRAGVVLLTTDGATWQRLTFPEVTDLSAVHAADARTATVTTADGREFSTTDGGRTWSRRHLQEFGTASF